MTDQVTRIIRRAKWVQSAMPFETLGRVVDGRWIAPPKPAWLLWIISDHEAYWIHTKTDKVVPSARNY